MRISGRWLSVAVVAGALLAAASIYALDRAFVSYMEDQARMRLGSLARGSIGLVESRLEQATTVLVDLAAAGVEDCSGRSLEAMRVAVFSTTPVKGLSVLDEQNRAVCTHVGTRLDFYAVSREYLLPGERLTIASARFRDLNERALRLRLDRPGGRSLAALIAADSLLPDLDLQREAGGRRLRLMFDSGEMIAARPPGDEGLGLDEGRSIFVRQASDRYPLVLIAEHSRSALAAEYRDLQFIGRAGTTALAVFGLVLIWLAVRRSRDDAAAALLRAMDGGEIIPFYQPIVDTMNGRIRGAEVLARWRKPDGTIVSPAQFIPLAEQSGLIQELTTVLMRRTRDEIGASYRERPRLRISFNLFAEHLASGKIVEDVKSIFGGSAISMDQLVLEVTERAPLADLNEARRVIEALQKLGIKVAIDDVGTGHGGLSYLLKLGVDIIKIDKMFIDAIGTERYSQTIIETLVELARTMSMEVVAEGVETVEQVEYLRLKGVNEAQGYVFAPPLPASSYLALVQAMERPKPAIPAAQPAASQSAA